MDARRRGQQHRVARAGERRRGLDDAIHEDQCRRRRPRRPGRRARVGAARRRSASRSAPIRTAAAEPLAGAADEVVERRRPWPVRRRSTRRARSACSEARAACGLVALESSTQRTPSTSATSAMRWASGRKARSPSRTAPRRDPVGPRQRRGGQRVGDDVWRRHARRRRGREAMSRMLPSSAALVTRSSMNARSASSVVDEADHAAVAGCRG